MRALALLLLYFSADSLSLPDLDGQLVQLPAKGIAVYLFTRTDCPISNRYAPEVRRLHERYASRNVAFWLVYVDPRQNPSAIRRHLREFGYPFGALLDARHQFVKLARAAVTPEAAVFRDGVLLYHGRIDDRYVAFGQARSAPANHDLANAIEAALAGRQPAVRQAKAIGCFIEDLR